MTTRFPSFATDTTADLWFFTDHSTDDEARLQEEEEKYQNWITEVTKKDTDAPYIGEASNGYVTLNAGEEESEVDTDDSNEQMGDDDLNELPDSPDEQVIPEIDTDDNGAEEDPNAWMNVYA